jgi:hypothetical protein
MSHKSQLEAALLSSRRILREAGFVPTMDIDHPPTGEIREYKVDHHQLRVLREHPNHQDEKHSLRSYVSEIIRFDKNGKSKEVLSRRLVIKFTGESRIASDWKLGFFLSLSDSDEEFQSEFKSKLEEMKKLLGILFPL